MFILKPWSCLRFVNLHVLLFEVLYLETYDYFYRVIFMNKFQGFDGDGYTCRLVVPCWQNPAVCDPNAECIQVSISSTFYSKNLRTKVFSEAFSTYM